MFVITCPLGIASRFTRTWPGFEDENSDDDSPGRADGTVASSLWHFGQTSRIQPQRMRTAALRSLVVGLAAAAPWLVATFSIKKAWIGVFSDIS